MYQFRESAIPCPPTHEGQPNSGHTFAVRGCSGKIDAINDKTTFDLQCTRCGFKTVFGKPLRKDIAPMDHVHDWQTTRLPMKTPYAFCFHCSAFKEWNSRLDADSYGKICDHCGPSEFKFYGTWLTSPCQRVYRCEGCDDIAARFKWMPEDCPPLLDLETEFLVISSPQLDATLSDPEKKAALLQEATTDWNFSGRVCDGCAKYSSDVKIFESPDFAISVHDADPGSMRYVQSEVTIGTTTIPIYFDYCANCRKENNVKGYRVLVASHKSYTANDQLACSLTKMKILYQ
jgi:hypothetical protein